MKVMLHRIPFATGVPFDTERLANHLRVDITEPNLQDYGRAAAGDLEQFAQIALLHQTIRATIVEVNFLQSGLRLPIGPVLDEELVTVTFDGVAFTDFTVTTGNSPHLQWGPTFWDLSPSRIVIDYQAGFGSSETDIPPDLSQAILDQAALHFDGRSPMDAKSLTSSPHMARVGARYRGVRV